MVKLIGPFASGVRGEIVGLDTLPITTYSFHQHPSNSAACAAESYQEEAVLQRFRQAQKIQPVQAPLKIALTHTGPPATALPCKDYLDRLQRRFGRLGNG
jgi:hypothetical protein